MRAAMFIQEVMNTHTAATPKDDNATVTHKSRYLELSLLLSLLLTFAWGILWWPYTVDDTYIALRYAENISEGLGAVFNPGERTEGYSCPSWVFLLAAAHWTGMHILSVAKGIGLAAAMGLPLLMFFTLRRLGLKAWIIGLATISVAAIPGVHIYATSGMETLPFTFTVAAAVVMPVLLPSSSCRTWSMPAVLLAIATLRPEGLLLFIVLTVLWWIVDDSPKVRWGLFSAVLLLCALLALRFMYYGSILPNTFLAKPSPLLHALTTAPFAIETVHALYQALMRIVQGTFGGIGGVAALCCIVVAMSLSKSNAARMTALATWCCGIAYVIYAPVDWMPEQRFALPFTFPLIVLAASGMHSFQQRISGRQAKWLRIGISGIVVVIIALHSMTTAMWWYRHERLSVNPAMNAVSHARIGAWLREHGKKGDSVLAYEIGAVGYYSKHRLLDHEGLISKEVARIVRSAGGINNVRYGTNADAMNEIVALCAKEKPDWFLVRSWTELPLHTGLPLSEAVVEEEIQQALVRAFDTTMVLRHVFVMNPNDEACLDKYLLLERKRVPVLK